MLFKRSKLFAKINMRQFVGGVQLFGLLVLSTLSLGTVRKFSEKNCFQNPLLSYFVKNSLIITLMHTGSEYFN